MSGGHRGVDGMADHVDCQTMRIVRLYELPERVQLCGKPDYVEIGLRGAQF